MLLDFLPLIIEEFGDPQDMLRRQVREELDIYKALLLLVIIILVDKAAEALLLGWASLLYDRIQVQVGARVQCHEVRREFHLIRLR